MNCPVCNSQCSVEEIERHVNQHFGTTIATHQDSSIDDHPWICDICDIILTETQKEKHMIYHKNHNKIAMDEVEFISNGTSSKPETLKRKTSQKERKKSAVECVRIFLEKLYPIRLKECFSKESTRHIYLAHKQTSFYGQSSTDKSWSCGYRNCQILLSSVLSLNPQRPNQQLQDARPIFPDSVPDIPVLQAHLKNAWQQGIDCEGQRHYGGDLTRKWLGAVEVITMLYYWGIHAFVVDFSKPSTSKQSGSYHPKLLEWASKYFKNESSSTVTEHCNSVDSVIIDDVPTIFHETQLPSLYFQFEGHSQSIIGVEYILSNDGTTSDRKLIILDPSWTESLETLCSSSNYSKTFFNMWKNKILIPETKLKKKQYQIAGINTEMRDFVRAVKFDSLEQWHYRKNGAFDVTRYP